MNQNTKASAASENSTPVVVVGSVCFGRGKDEEVSLQRHASYFTFLFININAIRSRRHRHRP